jgi:hypothetical protein
MQEYGKQCGQIDGLKTSLDVLSEKFEELASSSYTDEEFD